MQKAVRLALITQSLLAHSDPLIDPAGNPIQTSSPSLLLNIVLFISADLLLVLVSPGRLLVLPHSPLPSRASHAFYMLRALATHVESKDVFVLPKTKVCTHPSLSFPVPGSYFNHLYRAWSASGEHACCTVFRCDLHANPYHNVISEFLSCMLGTVHSHFVSESAGDKRRCSTVVRVGLE